MLVVTDGKLLQNGFASYEYSCAKGKESKSLYCLPASLFHYFLQIHSDYNFSGQTSESSDLFCTFIL